MSIYYIDGSNGDGVDSAGRGLTTSDPYLTPQFALDDAADSHTPSNTDIFKVIGTVTPTADLDFSTYDAATGNQYCKFVSDGATAFGTHSYENDVRATWDVSSNGGQVVDDSELDDVSFMGFEVVGMVNNTYVWHVDNFCSFIGIKIDFTGLGFDRPKVLNCDAGCSWMLGQVFGAANTSSGTYYTFAMSSSRAVFAYNYAEFGGTNLTAFLVNLGSYGTAHSNVFKLSGSGGGVNMSAICQVWNNDFYGATKESQRAIRLSSTNPYANMSWGNHFENLDSGIVFSTANWGHVLVGPNSYFNVNDPRLNMNDDSEIVVNTPDIELNASGFIDAPNNDFRSSAERAGIGLASAAPNPYYPANDISPGTRIKVPSNPYTNPFYRV